MISFDNETREALYPSASTGAAEDSTATDWIINRCRSVLRWHLAKIGASLSRDNFDDVAQTGVVNALVAIADGKPVSTSCRYATLEAYRCFVRAACRERESLESPVMRSDDRTRNGETQNRIFNARCLPQAAVDAFEDSLIERVAACGFRTNKAVNCVDVGKGLALTDGSTQDIADWLSDERSKPVSKRTVLRSVDSLRDAYADRKPTPLLDAVLGACVALGVTL